MNHPLTPLILALVAAPFLAAQEAPPPPPPPPTPVVAPQAPTPPTAPKVQKVGSVGKVSKVAPLDPQAPPPPPPPVAPKVQMAPPAPPSPPAPVPAGDVDPAIAKQLRSRVFIIQHREAKFLGNTLKPLLSGVKGAVVDWNTTDGMKALSVRDFPENIATIEEALKRLDVPVMASARKEVEFHIHVLFASNQDGPSEGVPADLKEVLASLKSTLKYRSYSHASTFVQRASEGTYNLNGRGQVELSQRPSKPGNASVNMDMQWRVGRLRTEGASDSELGIAFEGFSLVAEERGGAFPGSARVGTDIALKPGEKVVVGTSTLRDQGLIVVLTAKVLN